MRTRDALDDSVSVANMARVLNEAILNKITALPLDWHGAGTVSDATLRVMAELSSDEFQCTAETGTGRSTLLLSNLSKRHLVFTIGDPWAESLARVQNSPLLRSGVVTFTLGPTQATLPLYDLPEQIDLVFIDGPHGFPFPELEYYFFYPRIRLGGFLIIDDIQIPSIRLMYRILRKDQMWDLIKISDNTAFFRRTDYPTLNPFGDDWWLQGYNQPSPLRRFMQAAKARAPAGLKSVYKKGASRIRHT